MVDSSVAYEPYVALSYVWGLTQNYTTVLDNIRIHQQQGSLETFLDKIPKVIRDAMDLVRRLGLRYLWVDSLCIVQNSKRSWTLNARMMNVRINFSENRSLFRTVLGVHYSVCTPAALQRHSLLRHEPALLKYSDNSKLTPRS